MSSTLIKGTTKHRTMLDELALEARLHGLEEDETDPWYTVLWSASGQSSEEALSWALVDKTA